jgi:hypothetical protein
MFLILETDMTMYVIERSGFQFSETNGFFFVVKNCDISPPPVASCVHIKKSLSSLAEIVNGRILDNIIFSSDF